MDTLTEEIRNDFSNKSLDVIVPILRSGAFTALHIAARLEIKNIVPVYYRYKQGNVAQVIQTPQLLEPLPENPNILIADSCLTSGTTLKTALNELKRLFVDATFFGAAAWLEEGIEELPGIKNLFWGKHTNEHKTSTDPNCINGIVVAPWESLEVDWNEIKNY